MKQPETGLIGKAVPKNSCDREIHNSLEKMMYSSLLDTKKYRKATIYLDEGMFSRVKGFFYKLAGNKVMYIQKNRY